MPAAASGAATEARMPTTPKSKGPENFSSRQPASCFTPAGTCAAGHMIESSSAVRVMELKTAEPAQAGIGAVAGNRPTANSPATHLENNPGHQNSALATTPTAV